MKRPRALNLFRRVLLSETLWLIFPTVGAFVLNRLCLREPRRPPALPSSDWSRRERHALLTNSEERRRNLEGKGPGLATVSAIVVAAVLIAMTEGWNASHPAGRTVLVIAAVYAGFSLFTPIYLVGPQKRDVVDIRDLERAARAPAPEDSVATRAAMAAMQNDLRNLHLANLLDAARRELSYALGFLLLWVVLVPVTGALRHDVGQPAETGRHVHPHVGGTPPSQTCRPFSGPLPPPPSESTPPRSQPPLGTTLIERPLGGTQQVAALAPTVSSVLPATPKHLFMYKLRYGLLCTVKHCFQRHGEARPLDVQGLRPRIGLVSSDQRQAEQQDPPEHELRLRRLPSGQSRQEPTIIIPSFEEYLVETRCL